MIPDLANISLTRPLAVIDLETTGVDPASDRVVEVAAVRFAPGQRPAVFWSLIDPGATIPAAATAVHGVGDPDVAGAPTFGRAAARLGRFLAGCDRAGFGVAGFDLPLLAREFARAGVEFEISGRRVLDALAIYRLREPRDLASAVRLYLGRNHTGAHSALADARAAAEVLDAQVGHYGLPATPDALHALLVEVDVAGRFRRDDLWRVVFGFGKYRGLPLAEVALADRGYLRWLLGQPLMDDARGLIERAAEGGRVPW